MCSWWKLSSRAMCGLSRSVRSGDWNSGASLDLPASTAGSKADLQRRIALAHQSMGETVQLLIGHIPAFFWAPSAAAISNPEPFPLKTTFPETRKPCDSARTGPRPCRRSRALGSGRCFGPRESTPGRGAGHPSLPGHPARPPPRRSRPRRAPACPQMPQHFAMHALAGRDRRHAPVLPCRRGGREQSRMPQGTCSSRAQTWRCSHEASRLAARSPRRRPSRSSATASRAKARSSSSTGPEPAP